MKKILKWFIIFPVCIGLVVSLFNDKEVIKEDEVQVETKKGSEVRI